MNKTFSKLVNDLEKEKLKYPVLVVGNRSFIDINSIPVAQKSNGDVWCWGENKYGDLPDTKDPVMEVPSYSEYIAEELSKTFERNQIVTGSTELTIFDKVLSGSTPSHKMMDEYNDKLKEIENLPVNKDNIRDYIRKPISKNELYLHVAYDDVYRSVIKYSDNSSEQIIGSSKLNGYLIVKNHNEFFLRVPFEKEKQSILNSLNYLQGHQNWEAINELVKHIHRLNKDEIHDVLNSFPSCHFKFTFYKKVKDYGEIYDSADWLLKYAQSHNSTSGECGTSGIGVSSTSGTSGIGVSSTSGCGTMKTQCFWREQQQNESSGFFNGILTKLNLKKEIQDNEHPPVSGDTAEFTENFYKTLEEFKEYSEELTKNLNNLNKKVEEYDNSKSKES